MKKYIFICIAAAFSCGAITAQQLSGIVTDGNEPLPGATVHWANTTIGTTSDAQGHFTVNRVRDFDLLVASYIGYMPDTVKVSARQQIVFQLVPETENIEQITVDYNQRGNYVGLTGLAKGELITFAGLTKMACCNLAESFENSAAVTVGYSDAISGARQIKMLGLTGVYSQLLDESRPVMRGLSTPYGLSYTPGMWLQSIQISKGTSSVLHGHEAISGQINLEYRKPTDIEPLFINGYFDQQLRTELNVASSLQINNRLSTVILAHGSVDRRKEDHNHDGFLDVPLTGQINFANRWLYAAASGVQLRGGVKYVNEKREGGQKSFRKSLHRGGTDVYGSRILNENLNAYLKAAMPVGRSVYNPETAEEMRSNIALVADYNYYSQNSFFGIKDYDGRQDSFYANALYNLYINKNHTLILGASTTIDLYDEKLVDRYTNGTDASGNYLIGSSLYDLDRTEREGGAFAEYNLSITDRFNLVAGIRGDYHNIYNWIVTPRIHMRWEIAPGLVLRGSAGKGSRSANLVTDNIGMLATGRRIVFADNLDRLEESLTLGGSLTWVFQLGNDDGASLSFDYFRTRFSNQIVADQEYGTDLIYLYNVHGIPTTDSWQGDFNWSPVSGFDIFATFRYTDTSLDLSRPDGSLLKTEKPLLDKFKTLINLQYATRYRKWVFDFTAQLNGQSRLPSQDATPAIMEFSPVYPIFFAQVSRKFRHVDIYLGCENIGNYRQKHPVISYDKPFDRSFNSSVVWGPLMGRKIYAGFRFNLL